MTAQEARKTAEENEYKIPIDEQAQKDLNECATKTRVMVEYVKALVNVLDERSKSEYREVTLGSPIFSLKEVKEWLLDNGYKFQKTKTPPDEYKPFEPFYKISW